MKTLYVLRHAKSDWADESLPDFDRPLNHRGRKAARAVGHEMAARGIRPDLVISSPAVRAKETVERMLHGYGEDLPVTEDRRIYEAARGDLIQIVTGAPEVVERLMIVGHNPGLQELVVALSEPSALREEAAQKFPAGALAEIRFSIDRWSDLAPGTGQLEDLIKPRDL
jgi:phosphohistidine phosphatase